MILFVIKPLAVCVVGVLAALLYLRRKRFANVKSSHKFSRAMFTRLSVRRPPGPPPTSWLLGLGQELNELRKSNRLMLFFEQVARKYGEIAYVDLGVMNGIYVISSPRLVKQLTQSAKDFGVVRFVYFGSSHPNQSIHDTVHRYIANVLDDYWSDGGGRSDWRCVVASSPHVAADVSSQLDATVHGGLFN